MKIRLNLGKVLGSIFEAVKPTVTATAVGNLPWDKLTEKLFTVEPRLSTDQIMQTENLVAEWLEDRL